MSAEWAAVASALVGVLSVIVAQYSAWRWPRGYHRKGDSEPNTPEDTTTGP